MGSGPSSYYRELLEEPGSEILMLDDFSVVLDSNWDRPTDSSTLNISVNFLRYMKELGLIDIWRTENEGKKDYIFYSHQHHPYSQIIYIFLSVFVW